MKRVVILLFFLVFITGCDKKISCNKISDDNEFYTTKINYEYKFKNDVIDNIHVTITTKFTDSYLKNSNVNLKDVANTYKEELENENMPIDVVTTKNEVILNMDVTEEYAKENDLSLSSSIMEIRKTFENDGYTCS